MLCMKRLTHRVSSPVCVHDDTPAGWLLQKLVHLPPEAQAAGFTHILLDEVMRGGWMARGGEMEGCMCPAPSSASSPHAIDRTTGARAVDRVRPALLPPPRKPGSHAPGAFSFYVEGALLLSSTVNQSPRHDPINLMNAGAQGSADERDPPVQHLPGAVSDSIRTRCMHDDTLLTMMTTTHDPRPTQHSPLATP